MKSTTSYQCMLLEIGFCSMEVLALQRVYRYITKFKNMPIHRLPHLAWNVGCKLQKNHKNKIFLCGYVIDIKKWFKRLGIEDLLELSSDACKMYLLRK